MDEEARLLHLVPLRPHLHVLSVGQLVLLHELAVDLYLRVRLDFVLAVALLAARRSPRYEYSCARSVREREAFLGRASIALRLYGILGYHILFGTDWRRRLGTGRGHGFAYARIIVKVKVKVVTRYDSFDFATTATFNNSTTMVE